MCGVLVRLCAGAAVLIFALFLHGGVSNAGIAENPLLITYGNRAPIREGDPDYRQLVRFSVPSGFDGRLHVRVFDADTGGTKDEEFFRYDTSMRYALFAASPNISDGLTRDEDGILTETPAGRLLGETTISVDDARDGRWSTLFSVNADQGEVIAGRREFFVLVEGIAGDDGNVFDVFVSRADDENLLPEGAKLYSFIPTVRVLDRDRLTELRLKTPSGVPQLDVGNFDTSGGEVAFTTPFRTLTLDSTGQGEWVKTRITLRNAEKDGPAAVTFGGGQEIPNDITFYVTKPNGEPLPIDLPPRSIRSNKRPEIALTQMPLSCSKVRFDASRSVDPEGTDLVYNWIINGNRLNGPVVTSELEPGTYRGRLELFDGSGVIGSGSSRDFQIFVKAPPSASFNIPSRIPLGTQLVLDAYASRAASNPTGLTLERYDWLLGDGSAIAGAAAEAGTLKHTYAEPAEYQIRLTVTESANHPCNSASVTKNVLVDAPPTTKIRTEGDPLTGHTISFDATASTDPDGAITHYAWDFGDGRTASKPIVDHTFHQAGDYTITLLAADDSGFEENRVISKTTIHVSEVSNVAPQAMAGGDKEVRVGEPLLFDASNSTDSDGEIVNYHWNFGDSGEGSQIAMAHTYWQPGRYLAKLTIQDNSGQKNDQATDTAMVTVLPQPNAPPKVVVKSENQATRFLPVTFDASNSADPDGRIIEYAWDFGDGSQAVGPVVDHTYSETGGYRVKLLLTDNHQPEPGQSEAFIDVNVVSEPNKAPVAVLGPDLEAVTGEKVSFDASGSSDADGTVLTYHWDFGDGNRSTGVTPEHIYQFPGLYTVSVTISDSHVTNAARATDTLKVTVRDPENIPPTALGGEDMTVKPGQIIQFDGSGSTDPDGNILAYHWDFSTGETSTMSRPNYTFHEEGVYRVRLKVTDDNSTDPKSAEDQLTVTVRTETDGAGANE